MFNRKKIREAERKYYELKSLVFEYLTLSTHVVLRYDSVDWYLRLTVEDLKKDQVEKKEESRIRHIFRIIQAEDEESKKQEVSTAAAKSFFNSSSRLFLDKEGAEAAMKSGSKTEPAPLPTATSLPNPSPSYKE
jgi:hypothetical protein